MAARGRGRPPMAPDGGRSALEEAPRARLVVARPVLLAVASSADGRRRARGLAGAPRALDVQRQAHAAGSRGGRHAPRPDSCGSRSRRAAASASSSLDQRRLPRPRCRLARPPLEGHLARSPHDRHPRGAHPTEGRIYRAQVGSFDSRDAAETVRRARCARSWACRSSWPGPRRGRPGGSARGRPRRVTRSASSSTGCATPDIPTPGYADEAVPQKDSSGLVLLDASYETRTLQTRSGRARAGLGGRPPERRRGDVSRLARAASSTPRARCASSTSFPVESYLRGVRPRGAPGRRSIPRSRR
jgi:hypothetical protein